MGIVYRARHIALQRIVALKMILAGSHAGLQELARFMVEVKSVARLQHPHIVQIFEVGEVDGRPFCALEYVGGGSLAQKLAGTPLPADEAAAVVEVLARAMHVAHQMGVIHRDLKPANVLLSDDGAPKITDFGLARNLAESGQTQTGSIMGTPSYMAPEQAEGRSAAVGPPADVYALGAILYECLTGRPPFRAATAFDTIQQVIRDEPVPPRQLQPKTPRDLETICLKCLHKVAPRRYSNALDLAADLQRFQDGEPILARPVGRVERGMRLCKRYPLTTLLVTGILISVLAGLGVSIHFAVEAEARATAESEERARADQHNRDLRRQDYRQRVALGYREWQDGNIRVAKSYLDGCPEEHRGWEWYYCQRLCNPTLFSVGGFKRWIKGIAFSPDRRHIAAAGEGGNMKLVDARDGGTIWDLPLPPAPGPFFFSGRNLAFSSDGKKIAVGCWDGLARIIAAADGKELLTVRARFKHVDSVALSADGSRLATFSQTVNDALRGSGGDIEVWELPAGSRLLTIPNIPSRVPQLTFNRDGTQLVGACFTRGVKIWDAATGKEVVTLHGHAGAVSCAALSPDGQYLISGDCLSDDTTLKLWSLATHKVVQTYRGHRGNIREVAFSRDGKRLVSAGEDYLIRFWDTATGRELYNLKGFVLPVLALAMSADDSQVAAGGVGGTISAWRATGDHEFLSLPANGLQFVSFSGDGNSVVAGSSSRTEIWNAETGQPVRKLNISSTWWAFSTDGKAFVCGNSTETDKKNVWIGDWDAVKDLRVLGRHDREATSARFSPDGNRLASVGTEGILRIWDVASAKEIQSFKQNGRLWAVAFSPDGRHVAIGGDNKLVRIWDTHLQKEVQAMPRSGNQVRCLAYSPDGRRLAAGCLDGTAKVHDPATGQDLYRLKGHSNWIRSLAFSLDGQRILTGSNDLTARLWDAQTGEEVLTLRGHKQPVVGVAFSPDGRRIATCDVNTIRVWDSGPRPGIR